MNRRFAFRKGHTPKTRRDARAAMPLPPTVRKVRLSIGLVCCFKVEPLCLANFLRSGAHFPPLASQCECPSCAEMARAAFFVARA